MPSPVAPPSGCAFHPALPQGAPADRRRRRAGGLPRRSAAARRRRQRLPRARHRLLAPAHLGRRAASRPERVIRGELVDLRPLTAADIERTERVANDPDYNGPFGTWALEAAGDARRRFELDGYLNHDHGRLVVADKSGGTVGGVSYIAVFHGPPPSNRVYNIGIDIDPAHAAAATAPRPRRCSRATSSTRTRSSASRPRPTSRTSPSSARSSAPGSRARACCAAPSGAPAPGTTSRSTASCAASSAPAQQPLPAQSSGPGTVSITCAPVRPRGRSGAAARARARRARAAPRAAA